MGLSLDELHRRAYEAWDRFDNYNYDSDLDDCHHDSDEGLYNYDYSPSERDEAIERIKKKKEQYRKEQKLTNIIINNKQNTH